ncbi:MAG: alpha-galactosidase [Melioribacteraceae bacterium]|nr:alpha-galactosidase [Melioribacteraceae bacterium]
MKQLLSILLFSFSITFAQVNVSNNQGWGDLGVRTSVEKNVLSIGAKKYERGIGTHSPSTIKLEGTKDFQRFYAEVGIDSETGKSGSARFIILGNGKEIYRSPIMRGGNPAHIIDLKLEKNKTIELLTDDGDDGMNSDHADWADVYFIDQHNKKIYIDDLFGTKELINIAVKDFNLIMGVNQNKKLYTYYLGAELGDGNQLNRLNPQFLEYSAYGVKGITDPAIKAVHSDGNRSTDLYYVSHEVKQINKNITEYIFSLIDGVYPFEVKLHYKTYFNENIIEAFTEITNNEEDGVRLQNFASSQISFNKKEYWLTNLYGAWGNEFHAEDNRLPVGTTVLDSRVGHTSSLASPSFMISFDKPATETEGEVLIGSIAWSGNWKLNFNQNNDKRLTVTSGINDFDAEYLLDQGKTFTTPKFYFSITNKGKGEASRILHRFARRYIVPKSDEVRPVVLNSWEAAYFDFTNPKLMTMVDAAAEIGVEMFVLDDGWFARKYPRNNDRAGLGDWIVNYDKLEGGLQKIIDYTNSKGLKFGLWIEAEMVNPKSELYEAHPDWVISVPQRERTLGRTQLILDFSNPAVVENIYNQLDKILTENKGIEYIKWDYNRSVTEPGSPYLSVERQSEFWIRQIDGYYKLFDQLRAKYPNILWQSCSSGGGRTDYGALSRASEFWTSDNTDAYQRLFIQYGASLFYPANTMACHVSASPNHQTSRITPLKFRFDVAFSGRLGLELDPSKMTAEEKSYSKTKLEFYKGVREITQFGDLYRLASPYDSYFISNQYLSEDKSKGLVTAYLVNYFMGMNAQSVKLQGLTSDKKYKIYEPDDKSGNTAHLVENNGVYMGEYLMNKGITLKMNKIYDSAVILLEEAK